MPRHYYRRHRGYYRRGPSNPICSLIYCSILIGFFVFIFWNTVGFSAFGYMAPVIGIVVFVGISGIIAAIVNAARRQSRLQAQQAGSIGTPASNLQGFPPQGLTPRVGLAQETPFQHPATPNPTTFQEVPRPHPVGLVQGLSPSPATRAGPIKFCTYCGTTADSNEQRFCANCGAEL